MRKNWWVLPAAIVGYILYKKFVLSQTFSAFFKSIDYSNLSLLNPVMNIIVQVNNPTDVTAQIQQIKGNLFLNGDLVGTVIGITPTTLEVGSSLLNIPVTLNYAGLSQYIQKLNNKGFKLDFNGTIMVDLISLPLVFSYSI